MKDMGRAGACCVLVVILELLVINLENYVYCLVVGGLVILLLLCGCKVTVLDLFRASGLEPAWGEMIVKAKVKIMF